jgi:hypothetical protein
MSTILGKSINDLKSSIATHGGLAHTNRFAVYMAPPTAALFNLDLQNILVSLVSGNFKARNLISDPRDITILCESCTLPGRQIMTLDYQTFRQPEKLPYGYINEDVTFSFLLTNDYYVKKLFACGAGMVCTRVSIVHKACIIACPQRSRTGNRS